MKTEYSMKVRLQCLLVLHSNTHKCLEAIKDLWKHGDSVLQSIAVKGHQILNCKADQTRLTCTMSDQPHDKVHAPQCMNGYLCLPHFHSSQRDRNSICAAQQTASLFLGHGCLRLCWSRIFCMERLRMLAVALKCVTLPVKSTQFVASYLPQGFHQVQQ